MKKLLLILPFLISSCSATKVTPVDTTHLSYKGTDVYYDGVLCAKLKSVEMAWDECRITKELSFVITDTKFDQYALNIIMFLRKIKPNYEIEVEYVYYNE
jgi:hypothetical protein